MTDHGPGHSREVKEERLSPALSEGMYGAGGGHENGYRAEGYPGDSGDEDGEAPLDFSMKREGRDEGIGSVTIPREPLVGRLIKPKLEAQNGPSRVEAADCPSRANGEHATRPNGGAETDGELPEGRVGEPPIAMPGTLPAAAGLGMAGLPGMPAGMLTAAGAGMFSALPFLVDPSRMPHQQEIPSPNGTKGTNCRPFKAYPKDSLSMPLGYYGLPNVLPALDPATAQTLTSSTEELLHRYRQFLSKAQDGTKRVKDKHTGSESFKISGIPHSPPHDFHNKVISVAPPVSNSGVISSSSSQTSLSPPAATPAQLNTPSHTPNRKRGISLPDERKDAAYWERRRKNNEAAKRSRDARRAKEDEIAIRAAFLEQENLKLRVEVAALKNETAKLRCMLYNSWGPVSGLGRTGTNSGGESA